MILKQPGPFKFPPLHFQTTAMLHIVAAFPSPEPLPMATAAATATTAVKPFSEVLDSGSSAPAEEPRNIYRRRTADRIVPAVQGVAVSFRLFDIYLCWFGLYR